MNRNVLRGAAACALLATLTAPAFAHITLETGEATVGSTYKAVLRVPHGCDGNATTAITLKVPEGFISAKPMPKAGWTLDIKTGDYAKSYTLYGSPVTSGAVEIRWSGGNLPDNEYDEFVVHGTLASDLAAGTTMFFPVAQTCVTGEADWTDTTGAGKTPAPALKLVAAASSNEQAVTVGDLEISGAFARATLPNAPVGGGFLTITNKGSTDDRLVAASSPAAHEVQLHEMKMDGDVMKMAELPDGIPVPAGQTVTLSPKGLHMMFMQLKQPFVEGTTIPVTLTFEKAGSVTVQLPVGAVGASAPAGQDAMGGMSGMSM